MCGLLVVCMVMAYGCERHVEGRLAFDREEERRFLKDPGWTGPLSSRLGVRVEAASWEELVAKVKPTFTWGNLDAWACEASNTGLPKMMWIDEDLAGRPIFRLEKAYAWQPSADQEARWVLVKLMPADGGGSDIEANNLLGEQINGRAMPICVKVTDAIPDAPGDGMLADYAIIRGRDPRGGTVYEIGWSHEMCMGSGHWVYRDLIYVWRDAKGVWRLLGEGACESEGCNGRRECGGSWCEVSVRWQGEPVRPMVFFAQGMRRSEAGEGPIGLPDLVSYGDAVLDGTGDTLPVALKWSGGEYMRAEKGDTLEKMAWRLVVWREVDTMDSAHYWEPWLDKPSPELLRQREACREELLRLNPKLSANDSDELVEGTQVYMRNN